MTCGAAAKAYVLRAGPDRRAEGSARGIAQGAAHRDARIAPKAPHRPRKRLDRRAARKARRDEGRGVLQRRQTLARQAVSTDSHFPFPLRRGVACLLRVFYVLPSEPTVTIENKNQKSRTSMVLLGGTRRCKFARPRLVQRPSPNLAECPFFKYLCHELLTLNNDTLLSFL